MSFRGCIGLRIGAIPFLRGGSSTAPQNTSAPTITPVTAVPGTDLQGAVGTWDWNGVALGSPAFTIRWERDGVDIGFGGLTYPGSSVVEGNYQMFVTATNANNESSPEVASNVSVVTAAAIVADTSPVMGARGHNQRIDAETGADGSYSVSGGTITGTVVTYERDNGGWAAQAGSSLAQGGWSLRKRVVVSADNAPDATFYSAAIAVASAPTLTPETFDDAADTWDLTPSVGGTLHWATSLTTESPTPDGLGGWTGTTLETGSATVPNSGAFDLVATLTGASGAGGDVRKMTVYLEAAYASSDELSTNFTINTSSAMEADTAKLLWFDGQLVNASGSTLTSWPDRSGRGFNLAQEGTVAKPTYDAAKKAVHFGTDSLLINTTYQSNVDGVAKILTDGGSAVLFAVVELDAAGQGANSSAIRTIFSEGLGANIGHNNFVMFGLDRRTYGSPNVRLYTKGRGYADAWQFEAITSLDLAGTKVLVEYVVNQTQAEMLLGGTSLATGTVNTAGFPNNNGPVRIGSMAPDGATLQRPFRGDIYEVYLTTNTSTSHRQSIRAELIAKHGL